MAANSSARASWVRRSSATRCWAASAVPLRRAVPHVPHRPIRRGTGVRAVGGVPGRHPPGPPYARCEPTSRPGPPPQWASASAGRVSMRVLVRVLLSFPVPGVCACGVAGPQALEAARVDDARPLLDDSPEAVVRQATAALLPCADHVPQGAVVRAPGRHPSAPPAGRDGPVTAGRRGASLRLPRGGSELIRRTGPDWHTDTHEPRHVSR